MNIILKIRENLHLVDNVINLASIGLYQSSLKGNEIELMNELNI
jgi:hypothetical protein